MKYVKKDGVVKEVSDNLEGSYLSAAWRPAKKEEYDRTVDATSTSDKPARGAPNPRDGRE